MKNIPLWVKYVFVFGLGVFLGYEAHHISDQKSISEPSFKDSKPETAVKDSKKSEIRNKTADKDSFENNARIPGKVLEVLSHIDQYQNAPDGYVGGRRFKNLERLLPQKTPDGRKINYQEWDVNPKIAGQNRGRERLVTGDDQSAYYTQDHYASFTKIR